MSRRRVRSRSAAVAVTGATLAAIAVHGAAWASDPPGFPSTRPARGSAAAPPELTPDDVARGRIAAVKKFARDKEADPKFAEHEAPNRACRIDRRRRIVTLTFSADGVLHCKLSELAEGYQLEIYILTVKDVFSTGNHYRVTVTPGDPLGPVPIRGTSSDVRAALEVLGGRHADYTEAAWWRAPTLYGPYHFDSGTVRIELDEAAISEETKLAIAPLYPLNLAVVALGGRGLPSYGIADGKISERRNRADLAYYFGVHFYPLSWNHNGNRKNRPGRYFSDDYTSWIDRVSLLAGVNLSDPTEGGYVGGAVEVYSGVSITGGWQPRKFRRLSSGYAVGQPITEGEVPTDAVWRLTGWGVGVSVDSTVLRPLLSLLGR